jgi:hypothetical protein
MQEKEAWVVRHYAPSKHQLISPLCASILFFLRIFVVEIKVKVKMSQLTP